MPPSPSVLYSSLVTLSIGAACLVLVLNSINLPVFVAAFVASRILDPCRLCNRYPSHPHPIVTCLSSCRVHTMDHPTCPNIFEDVAPRRVHDTLQWYALFSLVSSSPHSDFNPAGIKRAFKDLTPRQSVSTTHRYFLSRKLDIVASETRRSHLAVLATGRDNSAIKSHATSTSHQPTSGKSNLRRLVLVEKLKLESPAPNVVGLDIALDSRYTPTQLLHLQSN